MSNKNLSQRSSEHANATLDALLQKGVQADQRATKPSIPLPVPAISTQRETIAPKMVAPIPMLSLERLSVRFTKEEAELLEKVRGAARVMGYKISDAAVFRLALNNFDAERMTAQQIESVLQADGRRK